MTLLPKTFPRFNTACLLYEADEPLLGGKTTFGVQDPYVVSDLDSHGMIRRPFVSGWVLRSRVRPGRNAICAKSYKLRERRNIRDTGTPFR